MTATTNTRAGVMCTLCGAAGSVETDVDKPAGIATAMAWAVHFADAHPEVGADGVSSHLVMTEAPA